MLSRRLNASHSPGRGLMLTASGLIAAVVFAACGGEASQPAGQPEDSGAGLVEDHVITLPDASFTMDDLVAAGYKKSKQFDVETVPEAREIWYGFFNQRDIEVRVYDSHRAAVDFGVGPAEAVLGKKPGQTDYLIPVVNKYPAYAVAGNLVMLCERELATCQALIEELQ